MIPSIKTIHTRLNVRWHVAKRVRELMEADGSLAAIGKALGVHDDVEFIPSGKGDKSPSIEYLNTGDPYEVTVMKVGEYCGWPVVKKVGEGRWVIGAWGDIFEKGDYVYED